MGLGEERGLLMEKATLIDGMYKNHKKEERGTMVSRKALVQLSNLIGLTAFLLLFSSLRAMATSTTTLSLSASTDTALPGQQLTVTVRIGPTVTDQEGNGVNGFEIPLEIVPVGAVQGGAPKISGGNLTGTLFAGVTLSFVGGFNPNDPTTWSTSVIASVSAFGNPKTTQVETGLVNFTIAVPENAHSGDQWEIRLGEGVSLTGEIEDFTITNVPNKLTLTIGACPITLTTLGNISSLPITKTVQVTATQNGQPATVTAWKVNGITGGDATVGTITGSGNVVTYTAPANVPSGGKVTITAETAICPAVLELTILDVLVTVTLPQNAPPTLADPTKRYLRGGQVVQLGAEVKTSDGQLLPVQTVSWAIVAGESGGTIDPQTGLFTATNVTIPTEVTVRATSTDVPNRLGNFTFVVRPAIGVTIFVSAPKADIFATNTDRPMHLVASVTNIADNESRGVTWEVVSGTGTIDAQGDFILNQVGTVRIRATSAQSVAEGNPVFAEVDITVKPPVSVSIVGSDQIGKGIDTTYTATAQNFLTVGGDRVTWSLQNAPEGTTLSTPGPSTSVIVRVPEGTATGTQFVLKAQSVDDFNKVAEKTLTVVDIAVNVTSAGNVDTLKAQGTLQFSATVIGHQEQTVTWEVRKADGSQGVPAEDGTIDANGLYQAPAGPIADHDVQIVATHTATGIIGTKLLHLVDVRITALTVDEVTQQRGVRAGAGYQATLTAQVEHSEQGIANWEVVGGAANGTVAFTPGTFTAQYNPPTVGVDTERTVTIRATTAELSRTAETTLVLRPQIQVAVSGPLEVNVDRGPFPYQASIANAAAALRPGETDQVEFFLENALAMDSVTSPDGRNATLVLDQGGDVPRTLTLKVRSLQSKAEVGEQNAVTETRVISVKPPLHVVVGSPRNQVPRSATEQFTADVQNVVAGDTGAVDWFVGPGSAEDPQLVEGQLVIPPDFVLGGNAILGTITATGLYTAPLVDQDTPIKILAVSKDDPRKFGVKTITVLKVFVQVNAPDNAVRVNKTIDVTATVIGLTGNDTAVSWKVNGILNGDATVGTISNVRFNPQTGQTMVTYTAPSAVPQVGHVVISAINSATGTDVVGNLTLIIRSAITVTIAADRSTARAGGNHRTLRAEVESIEDEPPRNETGQVQWTIVSGVGEINPTVGTQTIYTPPTEVAGPTQVVIRAISIQSQQEGDQPPVSAQFTLTVLPRPHISAIDPQKTVRAGEVALVGSNFGDGTDGQVNSSTGTFTRVSWSDTRVSVRQDVPPADYQLWIVVDGSASNRVTFTRLSPNITLTVEPSSVRLRVGETAKLRAKVVDETGKELPDEPVTWSSSGDGAIVHQDGTVVAAGAGNFTITAQARDKSATVTVVILEPPFISGLSKTLVTPGEEITISGSRFGQTQGDSTVKVGTQTASVVSWSDTSIRITVPSGVGRGNVQVVVNELPSNLAGPLVVASRIELTPSQAEVLEGESRIFTARVLDVEGNLVSEATPSFSVTNRTGEATIDDTGTAKGIKAGDVDIVATFTSLRATATLTVKAKPIEEAIPTLVFDGPRNFSTGLGTFPTELLKADLTGDGINELVFSSFNTGDVGYLPGQPAGQFGSAVLTPAGSRIASLDLGDLDRDGRPDIVAGDFGNGDLNFLLNTPAGFILSGGVDAGLGPIKVKVADLNGDGRLDLLSAGLLDNRLRVFRQTPQGRFTEVAIPLTEGFLSVIPTAIEVTDLNGDGVPDILVATIRQGILPILGSETGDFTVGEPFATGLAPRAIALANLTGAKNSLLVADGLGHRLVVLNQEGTRFIATASFSTGLGPRSLALADFDGDGKTDVAVANETSRSVSILLGKGDGTFGDQTDLSVGGAPGAVVAGDFDGDGKADIAVLIPARSRISVFANKTQRQVGTP